MLLDVMLILAGLVTTAILAFATHDSQSRAVRVFFWGSLLATGAIIVYSGISGIRMRLDISSVNLSLSIATNTVHDLEQQVERYKPFRITEQDKATLTRVAKEIVAAEIRAGGTPPSLHFLTFPGQSADAAEFQEILKNAFKLAGKETVPHHNLGITGTYLDGTPWDGVIVQINDTRHPPLLGQGIFGILNQLGVKVWLKDGSGFGTNTVVIYSHRPSYRRTDTGNKKESNK